MASTHGPENRDTDAQPAATARADAVTAADGWVSQLGALLNQLEEPPTGCVIAASAVVGEADNHLVQVRLGAASSLFAALRCKHGATAEHAFRVALNCSAWATNLRLGERQRDAIEVAALLHDVGVIGIPDHILLKPGNLDQQEAAIVARSRHMTLEILRQSCTAPEILEIIEYAPAGYEGSRPGSRLHHSQIPLGARMIAIAEAFDAMVNDQPYRPARSQEWAAGELFRCAGTQFDPELVKQFVEFQQHDQSQVHEEVASRWLRSLDVGRVNACWQQGGAPALDKRCRCDALFQDKLLENMYDAVVFIDATAQITLWNRGAERLTGIPGDSVLQTRWQPSLLSMSDEKGHTIAENDCPVTSAIRSGVQSLRRLTIWGRNGRPVAVDTHAIPVLDGNGATLGAILLFHDASSETSLERRCQSLHERATMDPLTQVANRAEFDRVHEMFVAAHQQQQVPCSLIICDLDNFKQVNDTYGHQAGDEVIKSLASLLKSSCRPGDLVARYGGEEFVVLCADCDNAASARRAEQVRVALSRMPQPKMDGRAVTASFGVTEIQPGDTPETMLRRADRALLLAKGRGRNQVVQLGTGSSGEQAEESTRFWPRKGRRLEKILDRILITPVPIKMAIEKLRGFVADHQAKIVNIEGDEVQLEIDAQPCSGLRRLTDRPITFRVHLRLKEERFQRESEDPRCGGVLRTRIPLSISPKTYRDRRRQDLLEKARAILTSLRSYLMATEEEAPPQDETPNRGKWTWATWLSKK